MIWVSSRRCTEGGVGSRAGSRWGWQQGKGVKGRECCLRVSAAGHAIKAARRKRCMESGDGTSAGSRPG